MLFTEANLKNMVITRNGNFKRIGTTGPTYYYHCACKECGYPFLGRKNNKFCSNGCRGKSKEFKQKRSELTKREAHPNWKGGVTYNNIPVYDTYAQQLEPYEQCRRNADDPNILEVKCTYCSGWYVPTMDSVNHRIRGINGNDNRRFYCSDECKKSCSIYGQRKYPKGYSPHKRPLQKEWALLVLEQNDNNQICEICGECGNIAHHIDPVVCNPIESADVDNGIIMCKRCHKEVHQLPGCTISELMKY
jgi:hypothetical protein